MYDLLSSGRRLRNPHVSTWGGSQGRTELGLIEQMDEGDRLQHLKDVMVPETTGVIATRGLPSPLEFCVLAGERKIPLLATSRSTTQLFVVLNTFKAF